jgi:hypothetical protein
VTAGAVPEQGDRTNSINAAAAEANRRFGAERWAADPIKRAKAVRVVRTAIGLRYLSPAEFVASAGPLSPAEVEAIRALLPDPPAGGGEAA